MFRIRVSRPAEADLAHALAVSLERWGEDGRDRHRDLLAAALRTIASDPDGPTTRDRGALLARIRSFHVRHVAGRRAVNEPVHVIYYRVRRTSIEVIRVLHERMDPGTHLAR